MHTYIAACVTVEFQLLQRRPPNARVQTGSVVVVPRDGMTRTKARKDNAHQSGLFPSRQHDATFKHCVLPVLIVIPFGDLVGAGVRDGIVCQVSTMRNPQK